MFNKVFIKGNHEALDFSKLTRKSPPVEPGFFGLTEGNGDRPGRFDGEILETARYL